ncbi:PREDICTED: U-box domain-containing protein 21 [Brassica oleracea var. oleracea]|uniref:U-box domain-containing protein n=1 Tax=Brassica oleracea var. oleracea TaxID=109376 RepID=A0A0D3CN65_BRAOL|nr:PREDICTED: U-box domain-containing protein 21 [Brassica oleracea var. oleracea]
MVLPWRSRGGRRAERRNLSTSGDTSVVKIKVPAQLRSSKIELVQSPLAPLTPRDAVEICRRLENATAREENAECLEIVSKIKNLARDNGETNKKWLLQYGVVSELTSCFQRFASTREEHARLLEEVLSVITSWLPLSRTEGFSKMGSTASLNALARFLNAPDAKTRQNAVFCIREVMAIDKRFVYALTDIEGAFEGLIKIIKDSVSTSSTKASIMAIYRIISCDNKTALKLVNLGLVALIAEMIVNNAEKSVCERCLVVLNVVCDNEQSREDVLRNALIVPLVVKKILRVSDLATQCSVSILWKLWRKNREDVLLEALQVGAFEKLLVVLQVGCEEKTKERASELLRNLNRCRNEMENTNCVDSSMHLKNVKKSF